MRTDDAERQDEVWYKMHLRKERPPGTCVPASAGSAHVVDPPEVGRRHRGSRIFSTRSTTGSSKPSLYAKFNSLATSEYERHLQDTGAHGVVIMAAIGSLVFCTDCGNLLEPNTGRTAYIQCDLCGTQNKGKNYSTLNIW
jgi:hypothetical protein